MCLYDFSVRYCLITALSLGLLFLRIFKRCCKRLCQRSCEHQVHALHTWCWAEKDSWRNWVAWFLVAFCWLLPGSSFLSGHQSKISGYCPFHIDVDFYLLIYYHRYLLGTYCVTSTGLGAENSIRQGPLLGHLNPYRSLQYSG